MTTLLDSLRRERSDLERILERLLHGLGRSERAALAREVARERPQFPKTRIAHYFGISRSSLYIIGLKRPVRDGRLLARIDSVLTVHPDFGHRRIARTLGVNRKRILRVMRKYGRKTPIFDDFTNPHYI